MKLGVVSLGCDKATVDSERLVGELVGHGAVLTPDLPRADVILVNTCGFIDAAKQESIDAILSAAKKGNGGGQGGRGGRLSRAAIQAGAAAGDPGSRSVSRILRPAPPRAGARRAWAHRRSRRASPRRPATGNRQRRSRALPQDLRRLRPHLRLLRDPVDAGEASLGAARAAGARGPDARSPGRAGDQPGGPGLGALRP